MEATGLNIPKMTCMDVGYLIPPTDVTSYLLIISDVPVFLYYVTLRTIKGHRRSRKLHFVLFHFRFRGMLEIEKKTL